MATNTGQLTTDELGDPDDGLEIRREIQERLLCQQQAVVNGERGEDLGSLSCLLAPQPLESS